MSACVDRLWLMVCVDKLWLHTALTSWHRFYPYNIFNIQTFLNHPHAPIIVNVSRYSSVVLANDSLWWIRDDYTVLPIYLMETRNSFFLLLYLDCSCVLLWPRKCGRKEAPELPRLILKRPAGFFFPLGTWNNTF